MKKTIVGISILFFLISCTKDEPKPECQTIDCKQQVAIYPKGGTAADKLIAALRYTSCCNKEPVLVIEGK